MIPQTFCVTDEQFQQLAQVNPDLPLEKTSTGALIVMAPTGSLTGNHNADIEGQLWLWNRQTQFGKVLIPLVGFAFPMAQFVLLMRLG